MTDTDRRPRLIGLPSVGRITGAPPGTVASWNHRGKLPEPDAFFEDRPCWYEETIVNWWNQRQDTD